MSSPGSTRRDELAANLARVDERIAGACAAAGRPRGDVHLTVVTKFFPASDVRLLADLGVEAVGENRHQEAEAKRAECADVRIRWHFIGGLQSNKASSVATYADVVESVDRARLLPGLRKGAHARSHELDVLVQVSLDAGGSQRGRSGVLPEELAGLADQVASTGMLRLRGLMAVAPPQEDPRRAFDRLADIADSFRREHPDATWLSAGMSGDLEAAVEHGATHVRIGRSVLGSRPSVR